VTKMGEPADLAGPVTLGDLIAEVHSLARVRPIFHSEADFQHALAWHLHERWPAARIRLEYRPFAAEKVYLDLWFALGEHAWAIELKYTSRQIDVTRDGERFALITQGAQDILRYDYIKDITRVERIAQTHRNVDGLALLLTNDPVLWLPPTGRLNVDGQFKLNEGRKLLGVLDWEAHTGGTKKGRETPHHLRGMYTAHWQDYSEMPGQGASSQFRFLAIHAAGTPKVDS
ncbi:MAG TPA: hypothetical protein VGR57_06485, partial [Ktedonobacterales bacterium]|nr:hypothetical protein [Ktedonobacterales bacterium]